MVRRNKEHNKLKGANVPFQVGNKLVFQRETDFIVANTDGSNQKRYSGIVVTHNGQPGVSHNRHLVVVADIDKTRICRIINVDNNRSKALNNVVDIQLYDPDIIEIKYSDNKVEYRSLETLNLVKNN